MYHNMSIVADNYLGVDPPIGFSNAFRMTIAVMNVNSDHITIKRIHAFLADRKNGMTHIPIKVQSCQGIIIMFIFTYQFKHGIWFISILKHFITKHNELT